MPINNNYERPNEQNLISAEAYVVERLVDGLTDAGRQQIGQSFEIGAQPEVLGLYLSDELLHLLQLLLEGGGAQLFVRTTAEALNLC